MVERRIWKLPSLAIASLFDVRSLARQSNEETLWAAIHQALIGALINRIYILRGLPLYPSKQIISIILGAFWMYRPH